MYRLNKPQLNIDMTSMYDKYNKIQFYSLCDIIRRENTKNKNCPTQPPPQANAYSGSEFFSLAENS